MLRKVAVIAAVGLAAVTGLVACAPPVTPSPSASVSPSLRSASPDTGRLETARSVYESYLNTRSMLTQSYEADPDALLEWATERQVAEAIADVATLVEAEQMIEGEFVVTSVSLVDEQADSLRMVACVDNSDVRLVDRSSGEAIPATPTAPSLITLVGTSQLRLDDVAAAAPEEATACG
jgi:hypothetical protein